MISLFSNYAGAAEHQRHDELDYSAPVVLPASNQNHLTSSPTQTTLTAAASAGCGNPITCENLLPGSPPSEWSIKEPGDTTIMGFATDASIDVGGTIRFKIKSTASAYHIDIYRAGWYQGNGARKVAATLRPSVALPQSQPTCHIDTSNTTGLIDCGNWAESAAWAVPTTAVSGVYFARLVRDDTGGASYIFFNVRNDSSHSAIVYQTSDTTRLAYNNYGGNSLYQCQLACPPGNPKPYKGAYKVSFNRPNVAVNLGMQYSFFSAEFQLVEFLEANGYDVSYISGVDTDRLGALLKNHSVFISSGQDEYWSGNQRTNVELARDAGVHLAFFSGDEVFWKTRFESSIDGSGTSYRTLVTYKETLLSAVVDPLDPPIWTGTWRDARFSPPGDGGRPENALTGVIATVDDSGINFTIQVPAADGKMRFWRNTAAATLAPGQTAALAPGTLGYEWDEDLDNGSRPPGIVRMSTTTQSVPRYWIDYGGTEVAGVATHHLALHRAPSGALIFGAGTVQWSWGLEGNPAGTSAPDAKMQQATVNLFADMGVQPSTLIGGLVPASTSTDFTPPTSIITSPAADSTVQAGTTVSIIGSATDGGGGVVGGVEVSTDGGATWHPVNNGRESWIYQWTPSTSGTFNLRSRAVDDSARIETPSSGVSVTVRSRVCPCTIWPSTTSPTVSADADTDSIEVGVKFYADTDGTISGLRFFKSTTNTGPHVGSLWTANGVLIARATFTNEGASGWQQVNFAAPVHVTSGTHYVASYHAPAGHYAADVSYFAAKGFDNAPLHALKDGVDGSNGVYAYSGASVFPTFAFQSTNYWVDVVFNPTGGGPADTTAPGLTSHTPANGATGVPVDTIVGATFNEAVQQASINFKLTTLSGVVVPATLSYNSTTFTAVLTPSSPLASSTTYFASVSRTSDASGNTMPSILNWSFTTGTFGAAASCPCTIWPTTAAPVVANVADEKPIEVGVKFRSDATGFISGIRFYKSTANTGIHVATLWTATGTLLAQATFTNESGSGWQQVNFPKPAAVTAGATYIASYHTSTGHYAGDNNYFLSAGVDNGPLHALRDGATGGNGVYAYSTGSTFPVNSFRSSNYWVDVVFAPAQIACPCTIWPSTSAPVTATSPDTRAIEVGVKFRADQSGFITGLRYFKSTTNTGTHVGSLWSTTGTLLARATFSNEAAAGWQQVSFAIPVAITAGTTYVASYHTNTGHYAGDNSYFAATGVDSGPLHALKDGVDGANGMYVYSTDSAFPTSTFKSTNYWVDVVFTSAPVKCPCTLWPASAAPLVVSDADVRSIEVGVKFRSDVNGSITGIRFYKGLNNTGTHTGSLWSLTGKLLATATFIGETASGWQQVNLSQPVTVVAGTTYVASYHAPTGRYASDESFFAGGGFDSGPLHALKDGAVGGNGLYGYSAGTSFPTNTFRSTNYWVDVVFTPAPSACPCMFWNPAVKPAIADGGDTKSIEVGVKFTSDIDGFITALRYYKSAANVGTHVAHLWTTTGTLLGSVTFANETASGWQQATFANAIAVNAGTVYVASYHADVGHYAGDNGYFTNLGVDKPPLHAPKDGISGGNGLYAYGAGPRFPANSFKSSNYWVDVVLQPLIQ